MSYYTVQALDDHKLVSEYDGNNLYSTEVEGKKAAIARAKEVIKEQDLMDSGRVTVQVIDSDQDIVWDMWV